MHLVDTTLFYSPTSGGVKRYLTAKHAWLAAHSSWEHTIVVPGREEQMQRGGLCTLAGYPVPATFNYRLPLNPRRWTRLLDALEPTLIEAADALSPGGGRLGGRPASWHSGGGFLSLERAAHHRPPRRRRARRAVDRPLCALSVRALRSGVRSEPGDVRVPRRSGRAARRTPAARRRCRGVPSAAAHAGAAPTPGPAGGGARAGLRRSLRRRKEPARAAAGFRAPWISVPPAVDRRRARGAPRRQRHRAALPARQPRARSMDRVRRRAGARGHQGA